MPAFTEAEIAYLSDQPLMRFATASPTGSPDVVPVGFELDGDDILTGGFEVTATLRYRNIQANPRATVVVDDLATRQPWAPRGIKVRGSVTIEEHGGQARFRISPEVIFSWGINDPKPGIPTTERRVVRPRA